MPEINKALSVTYKLLFTLSTNIFPSQRYRYLKMDVYIRDRAFPVTRLPALIYTKLVVSNDTYIDTGVTESVPFCKRVNF